MDDHDPDDKKHDPEFDHFKQGHDAFFNNRPIIDSTVHQQDFLQRLQNLLEQIQQVKRDYERIFKTRCGERPDAKSGDSSMENLDNKTRKT